jgi:hypothetical protein
MKKVQKNIYFSDTIVKLGEKKAKTIGLSFNEWVKYLVTKEVETISEVYEIASPELEEAIGRGLEDHKAGRLKVLSTDKEIEDYLTKLKEENE